MFGLTGLRLGGAIAGLLILLAAVAWLVSTVRERDRLAAIVDGHKACTAALTGKKGAAPVATACEAPIWAAVEARDAALACDAAVQGRDLYQIRMTCSQPVKLLHADLVTLGDNFADQGKQLIQARAGLAAAVTRAETRVATANRRTLDATQAAARAPRDPDGLVVCAGDCLRALGGSAAINAAAASR